MVRKVFISGTSRGIGAECARVLLARGWQVVGLARGDAAEGLAGPDYEHHHLDLSDLSALSSWCDEHLAPQRLSEAERIGLVNNAALLRPVGPLDRLNPVEFSQHLTVNVVAPTTLTGRLLRHASQDIPLRVINLSSGAATGAYAGWTAYCASKAALRMTDAVLAAEAAAFPHLQERDLAVVTYAPHVVATRMQEDLRSMETCDFPDRERFVGLEATGQLVEATGPANQIADLLEQEGLALHSEQRYSPSGGEA